MKKRKVLLLEKELHEEEMDESIELIKMGLGTLDDGIEIETPNLEWFEQMVIVQQEVTRKKLLKEVIIFLAIALIIVSFVLFTLYQLPIFFFALQGMATLFVIAYSAKHYIKQVDGV